MKRLIFQFYIFFLAAMMLTSCHKDSKVVPDDQANADISGSIITMLTSGGGYVLYVGVHIPILSYGAVGAYYLDLANGIIYGPKTASGWGSGLILKGNAGAKGGKGATGAAGSKIYAGAGVPPAATGNLGDYFFDKTHALLYGPKSMSGWGVPTSLKGPAGPPGNPGPVGPKGGNSNVTVDQFTVKGSDWLWNSQYVYETSPGSYTEYFTRYYVRQNSTISQAMLNDGMVLVYFTPSPVNNPNQWEPLAYQFDSSFGYTYNYVFVPAVGQVTLHYFFIQTDPTATLPTLSTYNDETRQFKIVTIYGETGVFMTQNHVNLNDYNEVSRITGLWQQDSK